MRSIDEGEESDEEIRLGGFTLSFSFVCLYWVQVDLTGLKINLSLQLIYFENKEGGGGG